MFETLSDLRLFLDLLSLFGINTFSPFRSPGTQRNWRIWSFFVLVFQSVVLVLTLIYRNYFLRSDLSPVGMLLNIVHYTWMMVTTLILIIMSITSERGQLEYWMQLEAMRRLRFQEEAQDKQFFNTLSKKSYALSLTLFFMNSSLFYFIAYDPQWTIYTLLGSSCVLVNRMFCLKVFICLEALKCEVLAFERSLEAFIAKGSRSTATKQVHIILAMDWHCAIIEASRHLLKLLEWSLFVLFIDGFLVLGVDSYWAYIHLACEKNYVSATILLVIICILLVALFLILYSSESVCEAHRRCRRLAGLMGSQSGEGYEVDELNCKFNFLVPKMRGEPLEFNVLQFFKLDLVLFAELLTTIPAYMIIYSQFLE